MIKLKVLNYYVSDNKIIYRVEPECLCKELKLNCNFRYVLDFTECCVDGCQNVVVQFPCETKLPLIYKSEKIKEYQLGYYINKILKCGTCHAYIEVKHNTNLEQDVIVQNNLLSPFPECCDGCMPCVDEITTP